jgi:hypothetical protein
MTGMVSVLLSARRCEERANRVAVREDVTAHGFRSCLRDWAGDVNATSSVRVRCGACAGQSGKTRPKRLTLEAIYSITDSRLTLDSGVQIRASSGQGVMAPDLSWNQELGGRLSQRGAANRRTWHLGAGGRWFESSRPDQ